MVTCCPYSLAIFTTTEYVGKCVHSILAILYHVISRFDIILRLYYMTLIYLQLRHMFCMFYHFAYIAGYINILQYCVLILYVSLLHHDHIILYNIALFCVYWLFCMIFYVCISIDGGLGFLLYMP